MPLQAPGKRNARDAITSFGAVNLRLDPTDIDSAALSEAIDVDLYERPGTILSRRGETTIYDLLEAPIRLVYKNYEGLTFSFCATRIFVMNQEVYSALSGHHVHATEYKGRNAPQAELFVANGTNMLRWTRREFEKWGLDSALLNPLGAVGAGTGLTGDYSAVYTYIRRVSGVLVHESNPSPPSDVVALSNQTLSLVVTASTDPQVTGIRIYRTLAGGIVYLFDQEVANVTNTVVSSKIDAALGGAVSEDNDPPRGATLIHVLRDRIWVNDLSAPNRLRWTPRFFPESFPANNFIDLGTQEQPITAISSINNVLIAFTPRSKFRLIEQDENIVAISGDIPFLGAATAGFVAFELPSSRGCVAYRAVISTSYGIIYPAKDGIYVTDGTAAPEQLLSELVQPLFLGVRVGGIPPIDFGYEANMAAAFYRDRYYLSFTSIESMDGQNDYTMILSPSRGAWFWSAGFSSFFFDGVHDVFYGGMPSGRLVALEAPVKFTDFSDMPITASVMTAERAGGDRGVKKLFLYMRVDAEVSSGDTLEAAFYADDSVVHTETITGNRIRKLMKLPEQARGHTWRVAFNYSGTKQVKIHGVETQYKSLVSS